MDWTALIPSFIALLGIPLAVLLSWLKEERQREKGDKRADRIAERDQHIWIQQQWWNRKADAYSQIVECLWQQLEYSREWEEFINHERGPVNQDHQKYKNMAENWANLKRAADVGMFVVSKEAATSLEDFIREGRENSMIDDPYDAVDADIATTRKCLESLTHAAMVDLRVNQPS